MRGFYLLLLCLLLSAKSVAFEVETVTFTGKETGIKLPVTVTLPDNYTKQRRYNVIYVLHGFSGNHQDWTKLTDIETLADQFNVIIVNPDGNYGSWYLDSPVLKQSRFATYIMDDLINFIDNRYTTHASKLGRAITGLSMGGFGALHLAINHPDKFAAVTAMSPGVDPRPFAAEFDLAKVLGEYASNKNTWNEVVIINNLHKLAAGNTEWKKGKDSLPIMIDIGVNDFFIKQNRALHQAMLDLRIRHTYIERDGIHDWHYWNNAIPYQFLFLTSHMEPH